MFDIWASVHELRQPCLLRAYPDGALQDDGAAKNSLFRSLDTLLWEHVECDLIEGSLKANQNSDLYTNDKWLTTSALQKCIRRGHAELAERYARSGVRIDADHTFRRMAIIAMEDIGLGDLKLIAAALAVLGDKRRRQRVGEERLAANLAVQMSRAVKSRLACELLSLVEYNTSTKEFAAAMAGNSEIALSEAVRSGEVGSTKQMIALWLLHGSGRLKGQYLPEVKGCGPIGLLRLMAVQRAPLIFHYIVRMGLSRCRDALAIPYAILTKMAVRCPFFETAIVDLPQPNMIGPYPSFAYDMHTRAGRRAIKEFEVNCTKWLRAGGVRDVGNLIFALEGGLLDERLTGRGIDVVAQKAMQLEIYGREQPHPNFSDLSPDLILPLDRMRRQVAVSG